MMKRTIALAISAVLTMAGLAFTASPAAADSAPGGAPITDLCGPECIYEKTGSGPSLAVDRPASCAGSSLCGYVDVGFSTGAGYEFIPFSTTCETVAFNNAWSSAYNNSGRTVRMFNTSNCTGSYMQWVNGAGDPNFVILVPPGPPNDTVSSVKFL